MGITRTFIVSSWAELEKIIYPDEFQTINSVEYKKIGLFKKQIIVRCI